MHATEETTVPTVHHEAGDVIVREGETSPCVFIIEDGEVEIASDHGDGGEQSLGRLGPGDFFGELSLLESLPSTETVRAASDCALLSIDRASLPYVLRENTDVALLMIRRLALRAREHQWQLRELQLEVASRPGPRAVAEAEITKADTTKVESAKVESAKAEITKAEITKADTAKADTAEEGTAHDPAAEASTEGGAYLLHPVSGLRHEIGDVVRTVLGRPDPASEFVPEVDLEELDTKRSTSRRHACIQRRDPGWVLFETGPSANGTFVNDVRLGPGEEQPLSDGDCLRLGLVELSFHLR